LSDLSVLSKRVASMLNSDLGFALLRTFSARGVAALGAMGLLFVVVRLYGPAGVGVLALAQAVMLGATLLARGGMDNALMRYVGQDHDSAHVLLYFRWALTKGLVAGVLVSAAVLMTRDWLEGQFDAPGLSSMLLGISLAVPAYVVAFLLSGFFKGVRMPATASLMENGSVALFAALILASWHFLVGVEGYAIVGFAHLVAAWLVVVQGAMQVWLWYRRVKASGVLSVKAKMVSYEQFRSTSRAFFATTFATFIQNVLAIMVAGWFLSTVELGLFKTSQQIGMLIAFTLLVLNAIFPPRFAALYHQGKLSALSRLARQGALIGVVVAMPLLLMCLIFPVWLLEWFGEEFAEAAPLLRIIALAQLVNVATGTVAFLLNMTGHEKLMRNIALFCNLFGLLGFWLLIPLWGPIGAAIALAIILVTQSLVSLFYVWRVLGIWTLPCPNLLALLGVKTRVGKA
jgi:O-antigen/teichoic acid export membrane protein